MNNQKMSGNEVPVTHVFADAEADAHQFIKYFNHPKFPQHRDFILRAHATLAERFSHNVDIGQEDVWREIVHTFVIERYALWQEDINRILERVNATLVPVVLPALRELSGIMQYRWPLGDSEYNAVPTLLPFSPFEGHTFYFSILSDISKRAQVDFPFLAVHEISHQVLYDQLQHVFGRPAKDELGWLLLHYLQEIIAPVVMNQEPLHTLLGIGEYLGNPNLHDIQVAPVNGGVTQITRYFQRRFELVRTQPSFSFTHWLSDVITLLRAIESELSSRQDMWNKYGPNIRNQLTVFESYTTPIRNKALE